MSKKRKNFCISELISKCQNLGAFVAELRECGSKDDSWYVLSLTFKLSEFLDLKFPCLLDFILEYGRPTGNFPEFDMHYDADMKYFYCSFPIKCYEV